MQLLAVTFAQKLEETDENSNQKGHNLKMCFTPLLHPQLATYFNV